MTEQKKGNVSFRNDWGELIRSITIRHRRENKPNLQEQIMLSNIEPGELKKNVLPFTYEVGSLSSFDYWWIKFTTATNRLYTIKNNFYCSVSSNDDGHVLIAVDGSDKKMYVSFSNSSSCKVSVIPEVRYFTESKE